MRSIQVNEINGDVRSVQQNGGVIRVERQRNHIVLKPLSRILAMNFRYIRPTITDRIRSVRVKCAKSGLSLFSRFPPLESVLSTLGPLLFPSGAGTSPSSTVEAPDDTPGLIGWLCFLLCELEDLSGGGVSSES